MKHLIAVPLFMLLVLPLFGQKGYYPGKVTLSSGSVIKGQICEANNSKTPVIKISRGFSDRIEVHRFEQVAHYTLENGTFHVASSYMEGNEIKRGFLQVLVRGDISLYAMFDEKGEKHFLIQKGDGFPELLELKETKVWDQESKKHTSRVSKLYYRVLTNAFSNCTKVNQSVQNIKLNLNQLKKAVIAYHTCTGGSFQLYKEQYKFKSYKQLELPSTKNSRKKRS